MLRCCATCGVVSVALAVACMVIVGNHGPVLPVQHYFPSGGLALWPAADAYSDARQRALTGQADHVVLLCQTRVRARHRSRNTANRRGATSSTHLCVAVFGNAMVTLLLAIMFLLSVFVLAQFLLEPLVVLTHHCQPEEKKHQKGWQALGRGG